MSVWFRSYVAYAVKISYEKYKELGIDPYENEEDLMENNEENTGWALEGMNGTYALYGRLVHEGQDNGNDTPLGGEGDAEELILLTDEQKEKVRRDVINELGIDYADKLKYYVVGEYS